jgi:predicted enzyme related to lactoylglutathione lyase
MTAPIVHFDITGPDDEKLRSFYERSFGWTINAMGPGYAVAETGAAPRGAIAEAAEPSVTIALGVHDIDAHLASVVANGGTVVMPATDNGWVTKAQITDPAGNLITLIKM